ncbi:MAG: decaprenyl-phosphate phosphoribosyltransferase [bacterium]|nr:decaprenyl-phosphate phosphoribosyltransferase [bacterium]
MSTMVLHYVKLARPHQWIKNAAVFVGPLFALKLGDPEALRNTIIACVGFCLVSSSSYAINDAIDRHADALHPQKRSRPVATGAISAGAAWVFAALLCIAGVVLVRRCLPPTVSYILAGYFALILAYSAALKQRPILDVIILAVGFVLRAVAGAAAIDAAISPWLVVCTFTLCMFLGFGKRRCELAAFQSPEEAGSHRATLLRYTPELLNHLISVSAGIAIITFLLYTMDRAPAYMPPFHKEYLLYTLPLVAYGLFRYAMLIEFGHRAGPTEIILKDVPLLLTIGLWGAIVLGIVLKTATG